MKRYDLIVKHYDPFLEPNEKLCSDLYMHAYFKTEEDAISYMYNMIKDEMYIFVKRIMKNYDNHIRYVELYYCADSSEDVWPELSVEINCVEVPENEYKEPPILMKKEPCGNHKLSLTTTVIGKNGEVVRYIDIFKDGTIRFFTNVIHPENFFNSFDYTGIDDIKDVYGFTVDEFNKELQKCIANAIL